MKKLLLVFIILDFTFPYNLNVNSNLQDGKLIDKYKLEFTSLIGYRSVPTFGSFLRLNKNINWGLHGIHIAIGISEKYNLRFGVENRDFGMTNIDYLSFGIKYQLTRSQSSIYLPITLSKYNFEWMDYQTEIRRLIQLEPTYLYTYDLFYASSKAYIPINNSNIEIQLGGSLGVGISLNPSKWIIRSEISVDNYSGIFTEENVDIFDSFKFNIGLSIYQ